MPGLLGDDDLLGLLGPGGASMGLLGGGFRPAPNEGLLTRFFGNPNNPNDPRGDAMMALGTGLMRGDFAGGMDAANKVFSETEDRNARRVANALTLNKSALELAALRQGVQRTAAIQKELAGMRGMQPAPGVSAPIATDPGGADSFGVPSAGGVPMFSQAGMRPQMMAQPPSPAMPAGYQAAASSTGGDLSQQAIYNNLVRTAQVYARNGDDKTANTLFERAAQFRQKFSTEPRVMTDPRTGKPGNFLVSEDGEVRPLAYGVKPDITFQDLGGSVVALDKNNTAGGQAWRKTMTPGEVASNTLGWANNSLGWANNRQAGERLNFERNQPQYMQVDGQVVALPKTAGPGGAAPVGRLVTDASGAPLGGDTPKLSEFQGKATTFATRMRDASRTLDQLESKGQSWPSTVNRAGYKSEFPSWLPGGQLLGGVATSLNNATVPTQAQQTYQAQQNWVTANLRQESGAAIGKDEMDKEIRKWFPQPGDGAEAIQQKARSRQVAEEAMLAQAGPGSKLVTQSLARADAVNAQKAQKQSAQPVPLPSTNPKDLKHGTVYELPGGKLGKWDSLQRRFEVQ